MINLILIFFLCLGTVIGLRRGLILQSLHLIGSLGSFIIAKLFYADLAQKMTLMIPFPSTEGNYESKFLNMITNEMTFYNVVSFIVIFLLCKVILQFIATIFDYIAQLPLLNQMNRIFGAILGFIESHVLLFIVIFLLSMVPVTSVQTKLEESFIANLIANHTPILSQLAKHWFEYVGFIIS